MEWLKELLGDAYTEDIDAGVRQYIGRNFVSKSDFRAKAEEVRNLTAELDEKKDGGGDLQKKLDELQAKYDADMKASADRYNDYRLTGALTAAKAKDAKLVASLLDRAKLDFTGDEIGGLEEQLKALQKSHSYIFDIPTPPNGTGAPASGDKAQETEPTRPIVL